jgi:hypothetical protein
MRIDRRQPETYRAIQWRSLWRRLLTQAASDLDIDRVQPNRTFEQGNAAEGQSAAERERTP